MYLGQNGVFGRTFLKKKVVALQKRAIYLWCNIKACWRNHCWSGKALIFIYSECVSLALFIQHAKCMRRTVLMSMTSLVLPYFSMLIIVQRDSTIYSFFIAANCSTCFEWWHHPSSGAHITVFTASGTGRSVWAATSHYRGWTETISIHDSGRGSSSDTTTSTRCYK